MVTVLKYQLNLGEGKIKVTQARLAERFLRFRPHPKYRLYFNTVLLYFVYPAT